MAMTAMVLITTIPETYTQLMQCTHIQALSPSSPAGNCRRWEEVGVPQTELGGWAPHEEVPAATG